ncbi:hypothetical protein [Serratia rhizosphaerae]|uniref:hypothetical protein n=1 Tax=Serratia rhizosphaerae TaxID=2597702 RepID=UPI002DBF56FD|nr:hypothetical protein [Serratia rhizosphaerae]MEB6335717.1 hypothetical protein [Serratia rhizosphaerae]
MKVIISVFALFFSSYAISSIQIYESDTGVLGLEETEGKTEVTSTLYGGVMTQAQHLQLIVWLNIPWQVMGIITRVY